MSKGFLQGNEGVATAPEGADKLREVAQLVVTDPAFGVEGKGKKNNKQQAAHLRVKKGIIHVPPHPSVGTFRRQSQSNT